ncbi:MAG: protein-L-isoaspartate(D-aspartate) O-methyltransferase [Pseudomonadota bacterium]
MSLRATNGSEALSSISGDCFVAYTPRNDSRRVIKGAHLLNKILPTIVLILLLATPLAAKDKYAAKRQALINEIKEDVRLTSHYIGKEKLNESVLEAMNLVPREDFVSKALWLFAYENRPLPIGYGQTISQPYIVALMTDLLDVDKDDVVFEVGTGSGYQAAILSKLVKHVYTIEIIPELAEEAKTRLKQLGYSNVTVLEGDGYYGLKKAAPFDGIIVTAAAGQIPPPLISQLKPGGKMIIPIGSAFQTQHLMLVEKDKKGKLTIKQVLPVRFVPLAGKH